MRTHTMIRHTKAASAKTEVAAGPGLASPEVHHILHAPQPQAKLTVGAPDDAFEREADQVAEQVMRMPEPGVQRMCTECEEEMEQGGKAGATTSEFVGELKAKAEPGRRPQVPAGFRERFQALEGGGRTLSPSERSFFEPRFALGPTHHVNALLPLQRTICNQAVQRTLRTNDEEPKPGLIGTASSRFGHDFSRIPIHSPAPRSIQTKLVINQPGDKYEQEADRVADQVMATPAHHDVSGTVLRIQRLSDQSYGQIDAAPASVDQALASPGRPLQPALRQEMEQRFGYDFSRVRVHTDTACAQSARDVHANAYTVGQDVVFGAGRFAPNTVDGRRLIAHELTHVVQQALSPGLAQPSQSQPPLRIQRDDAEGAPSEEPETQPSREEEALARQGSEKLRDTIHSKYWSLQLRIAKAEAVNYTPKRQEWLRKLEAESGELERIQTQQGGVGLTDVIPLSDRLNRLTKEVDAEHRLADTLWKTAVDRYSAELIRLQDQGDSESELAAKFLNQAFDELSEKIDSVIVKDTMVQDDFSPLIYILDNQTYLKSARIVEERQRKEEEEELERLSEVPEEGPGILETAWSIVGCDSVLECFGDVALTVLTAGTGKAVKAVVKGTKAARKVQRVRKVVRTAEQLDKSLGKVLKAAKGVGKFVSIVKDAAVDAASTYGQWLKKDWKRVASRVSTDLIGGHTTGAGQGAGTVAVARMNKDFIANVLEQQVGMTRANPRLIQAAIGWVATKRFKMAAARVRTFISQALKFRTAVNVSFESLRAGTPLTESNDVIRRTLVSTIGEVAQDTVQAVPVVAKSGLATYLTEAIRKVVQGIFG